MTSSAKSTYYKKNHANWLMVLALFFSLLTFSNYGVNAKKTPSNPIFQTEWVKLNNLQQAVKLTFKPISVKPQLNQAAIEVEFSRTVRLRLSLLKKLFCANFTNPIFLIQKRTPNYHSEAENNNPVG
ncbi:hypothetical protein DBR40_20635 [Pedobacter sp. KBW01]|uniref:hypothetical protein n=1 Tax=Pedobacter sp. KBW01 TaxID=2153364 RepID=UPI000F5B8314|nr:hypothetical protein [Pedobacter sp. KBW01]RQO68352.1 hypothetical protein DBR40_20635 [Pedobacter sp. KBW01]